MSTSELNSPHVMIADGDPQQLRFLVTALRSSSYSVTVIENEIQVYTRVLMQLPDILVMDVHLPDRNGIKIARLLKENSSTRLIPIIFLSNLSNQSDRVLGLQAGAVDYILKPYHVDEVLERIRIHINLSRRKSDHDRSIMDKGVTPQSPSKILPASISIKQVVTEFITSHISNSALKGSDIATSMGLSMHRLNMVFETTTGMTVFEFIRKERMEKAAQMLETSSMGIADVATEVGYANSANFSTEFKKFWNKSPKQYRMVYKDKLDFLQTQCPIDKMAE